MKSEYDKEVEILDQAINDGKDVANITPHDIKKIQEDLLNLEIKGQSIPRINSGQWRFQSYLLK
jgi:hypothetical protein